MSTHRMTPVATLGASAMAFAALLVPNSGSASPLGDPYRLAPASTRAMPAAIPGSWDEPYVLFQPARRSGVRDVEPATIVAIDDLPMRRARAEPLYPGLHHVEVSVPGPRGMSRPGRRTIVVDARPCTRYYLGVKRSSRMSRDWDVFVDQAEPIGECEARFLR